MKKGPRLSRLHLKALPLSTLSAQEKARCSDEE